MYEEVGLDIKELIKLDQFLEVKHKDIDSRMYIITDIPEDTNFEPKARKEIRASHKVLLMLVNYYYIEDPVVSFKGVAFP